MTATPKPALTAKQLLAEKARRQQIDFLVDVLPQQRDFVLDPSHFKCLFGTRRMGKSMIIGLYLFMTAYLNPGCTCLYLGLYRLTVNSIMNKDVFMVINRRFYHSKAKWNYTNGEWTFPNGPNKAKPYEGGSIIRLRGADANEQSIASLVGQKYKLAILDEASKYRHNLRTLIYEALLPAMGDDLGTIVMSGTPSNLTQGLFYEITSGIKTTGWKVHSWTWRENIYAYKNIKVLHDKALAAEPNLPDTPGYKQEWLGQWVVDDRAIVYRYNPLLNYQEALPRPEKDYTWLLTVDTGFKDETAFGISAYSEFDHNLYLTHILHRDKLIPGAIAKIIYWLWKGEWHPKLKDVTIPPDFMPTLLTFKPRAFAKIIMDCGAQALAQAEEFKQRYHIPIIATDKSYKKGAIDMFNSDMITGRIKVMPGAIDVIRQFEQLIWDERFRKYSPPKFIEDSRIPNDMTDVCLYAARYARNYLAEAPPDKPLDPYGQEVAEQRFFALQARLNKPPEADDWIAEAYSGMNIDGEDMAAHQGRPDTSVEHQIAKLTGKNRW